MLVSAKHEDYEIRSYPDDCFKSNEWEVSGMWSAAKIMNRMFQEEGHECEISGIYCARNHEQEVSRILSAA